MNDKELNLMTYTAILGRPAYGRDYQTKEAMQKDWNANKDFRNVTPGVRGSYFSKSTVEMLDVDEVILSNKAETIFLTIKP